MALFGLPHVRFVRLLFSAETVFFSHNNSTRTVFQPSFSKPNGRPLWSPWRAIAPPHRTPVSLHYCSLLLTTQLPVAPHCSISTPPILARLRSLLSMDAATPNSQKHVVVSKWGMLQWWNPMRKRQQRDLWNWRHQGSIAAASSFTATASLNFDKPLGW